MLRHMRHHAEYEVTVSLLGKLLGYHLERQPTHPNRLVAALRPLRGTWKQTKERTVRTQPEVFRADGGLFGPTAYAEVYPGLEMIRTPDNSDGQILPVGARCRVGVVRLRRTR